MSSVWRPRRLLGGFRGLFSGRRSKPAADTLLRIAAALGERWMASRLRLELVAVDALAFHVRPTVGLAMIASALRAVRTKRMAFVPMIDVRKRGCSAQVRARSALRRVAAAILATFAHAHTL